MCLCSRKIAFSLVTLCGIAVIAILRRSHLRNATKQTANKKDIISQEKKDIISQLPDDILISIITRMDTKFAVRTSILSKRWKNLYKFMPDINFCCNVSPHSASGWHSAILERSFRYPYYSHEATIIYTVERFLRLSSRSKFRSFHFRYRLTKSCADQFEKCIHFVGRLGVEELVVYFSCCRNFPSCRKYSCCTRSSDLSFSCHLLSEMPSLKYFQLALCSLQPNLKTQCNSLKTLSLMDVKVLPGALECILSNCLMLHSLIIDGCSDCPSKLCFRGPNLLLKSLVIKHCEDVEEIELYASNLITFEFHNPQLAKFIFDHVPQLQSIHLYSYNMNIMSYVFGELAQDLPHLKSLAFSTKDDFDQESKRLARMGIETFSNLRRLELKVYCVPNINLLSLILESFPLLHEFHLDIPYDAKYDGGGAQPGEQVVLHSELKKVKINGFGGTENEIALALYILKSAVNLEQMHIVLRFNPYSDYYNMRDTYKSPRHKMIKNHLQGHALSKTVQVIIKYANTSDFIKCVL